MFWSNKNKLPITIEDKNWVDENVNWLKTELKDDFYSLETITPTKKYFSRVFDGSRDDARYVLRVLKEIFKMQDKKVSLRFFNESSVKMSDGSLLTSPADIHGKWNGASGTYQEWYGKIIISIEESQLKNPTSLIATMAHELSHYFLLGQNRIEENDELLTDLTAIVFGFGIFLGNSNFTFNQHVDGWSSQGQGYMPNRVIAYAMAKISLDRNESTDYVQYLKKSTQKYFNQSLNYLKQ